MAISGSDYSLATGSGSTAIARIQAQFLDLPLLRSSHDGQTGYVALAADPWPSGGAILLRSQSQSGWQDNASISDSAIMGESLSDFAKGPVNLFDRANHLDIEIFSGSLLSVEELDLFSGANSFAIQTMDGDWEVFQAQTIELIGTRQYRLSKLLRGQLGTQGAMVDLLAAGAPIVYLSEGIAQVDMSLSDVNKPYYWRYGPSGEAVGSDRFTTEQHAFKGRGLVPYSPAHARWKVDANSDHVITWIRRTRIDGDSWDLYRIPLGEEREAYEIDILIGETLVRTFETSAPKAIYSQTDRIADLGSATASYSIRVYQISALVGRGDALEANRL